VYKVINYRALGRAHTFATRHATCYRRAADVLALSINIILAPTLTLTFQNLTNCSLVHILLIPKFQENLTISFWVITFMNRETDK